MKREDEKNAKNARNLEEPDCALELLARDVVDAAIDVHRGLGQVLSYLKATGQVLGLLINFNVPLLRQGIRRIVLTP